MPFTSGTAETPTILLDAINTHLIANSWTNLRGETDMSTDSPISARYWRILVTDTQTTSSAERRLAKLEFRTTLAGANVATTGTDFFFSALGDGEGADLIDDSFVTFVHVDLNSSTESWAIGYDFGSATIIRQVLLGSSSTLLAQNPASFFIQWSTDNVTWTTMNQIIDEVFTLSEEILFSFDTGFRWSEHAGLDLPRKSGAFDDVDSEFQQCEDTWQWQGAGYDAARRVLIAMRANYNIDTSSGWLECTAFTSYNALLPGIGDDQEGGPLLTVKHAMGDGPVDYWLYSNALRIVLVTKTGVNNYHSTYLGFTAAFTLPDEFPFPLLIASTQDDFSDEGTVNAKISSMADPGDGSAHFYRWDNTWNKCQNRPDDAGVPNAFETTPVGWTFPWHTGSGSGQDYPNNPIGAVGGGGTHWLDQTEATEQDEQPLIAVVVMDVEFGNMGAMDGVFCVPGSGVLVPDSVVTISAQDYRIFPNIQRRNGLAWFAVRED